MSSKKTKKKRRGRGHHFFGSMLEDYRWQKDEAGDSWLFPVYPSWSDGGDRPSRTAGTVSLLRSGLRPMPSSQRVMHRYDSGRPIGWTSTGRASGSAFTPGRRSNGEAATTEGR